MVHRDSSFPSALRSSSQAGFKRCEPRCDARGTRVPSEFSPAAIVSIPLLSPTATSPWSPRRELRGRVRAQVPICRPQRTGLVVLSRKRVCVRRRPAGDALVGLAAKPCSGVSSRPVAGSPWPAGVAKRSCRLGTSSSSMKSFDFYPDFVQPQRDRRQPAIGLLRSVCIARVAGDVRKCRKC